MRRLSFTFAAVGLLACIALAFGATAAPSLPAQSERVNLPLVLRQNSPTPTETATPSPTMTPTETQTTSGTPSATATVTPTPTNTARPSGWITVMREDFEGTFPGRWLVLDQNGATDGEYYWSPRECRVFEGSRSGWALGGGAAGSTRTCGDGYPPNASAWMGSGFFSLVGATDARFSAKLWVNTASRDDQVCLVASYQGAQFQGGTCYSGDRNGWIDGFLDLKNVPNVGNIVGRNQAFVALLFQTHSNVQGRSGAFADNVLIEKYVSPAGAPNTADNIGAPPLPEGFQSVPIKLDAQEVPERFRP